MTIKSFVVLVSAICFSGCVSTIKTESKLDQQEAKISYRAYQSGTLFLADKIRCTSLLGLRYNERETTPIMRSNKKLNADVFVIIPASDNHTFLATTDTLLEDKILKFWFKFPVKASKSYRVYIHKTNVDKKLFNLDRYKYNSYHYSIGVLDELDQVVNVEEIYPTNLSTECKPNLAT